MINANTIRDRITKIYKAESVKLEIYFDKFIKKHIIQAIICRQSREYRLVFAGSSIQNALDSINEV